MKLYLDCSMGAAGDMLMAALYELLPDKRAFREKMERLGLLGVTIEYSDSIKCGVKGTHVSVVIGGAAETSGDVLPSGKELTHEHEHGCEDGHAHEHEHGCEDGHGPGHEHGCEDGHGPGHGCEDGHAHDHDHGHSPALHRYAYREIEDLIRSLDLSGKVIGDALGVYKILAEAEANVHGGSLDTVHFHEVGSLDAIVDIVGCSLLMEMLEVTDVIASPVHTGSGFVRCDHGILPVPAPATAEILKGVPICSGRIRGELCTPSGAALLKHFVTRFGEMPVMTTVKIGYGMGSKDFEAANCIRAFLCESVGAIGGGAIGVGAAGGGAVGESAASGGAIGSGDAVAGNDTVYEISCNLDDMTPEAIGAVFGQLFENGALDVFTAPISMKKNRPAVMLSCLCTEQNREALAGLILRHTSTLGVRISVHTRMILSRSEETVATDYGVIRVKRAEGMGVIKHKPEYDDVLEAAYRHVVPFVTVYDAALRVALEKEDGSGVHK